MILKYLVAIVDVIKEAFEWSSSKFEERFAEYADIIFQKIQDAMNHELAPDFGPVVPYVSSVNAWIPLDFIGIAVTAWLGFQGTIIAVRWILKFIPTIG